MRLFIIAVVGVVVLAVLIGVDLRKRKVKAGKLSRRAKSASALQEFLPIERFHESGALVVHGHFRKQIRVGDMNLHSMSLAEIQAVRDRFKEMLKYLDHPFQLSVQARRANYTDFLKHAEVTINEAVRGYQNQPFAEYAESLKGYLREEAQKPRTDRSNLIVIGVLPKVGGENEKAQIERLEREQGYVEAGISSMGLPYEVLDPIESIEAIQNFWNRERAVSQRYRDAFANQVHAPRANGADVEVTDIV
ncbi:hypothetical protein [Alicyclobacillus mengziensis]|uniref:Uncharacterized protein n=1 Tax=Alicyclobacillus mengziensis TaxID=2931921 RepID=A0A9X7W1X3_9BACL|nr:hypothetical protein [Alicyclobacillus mengziensis]QSO48687.1 hypothetical protein JZ786_06895 [Alicyclobacillus mengziensis]